MGLCAERLLRSGSVACRLHIPMYGCSELFVFEEPIVRGSKKLGVSFNRWAETNRIVVVWPHTVGSMGAPMPHESRR